MVLSRETSFMWTRFLSGIKPAFPPLTILVQIRQHPTNLWWCWHLRKGSFQTLPQCLKTCLLLALRSAASGGKCGSTGCRQFVLKSFLCNLWLNICHSRHIYSNSITGWQRWIFHSPSDQKKIGRIYLELPGLSVLNGFMHIKVTPGKWDLFCILKIQALLSKVLQQAGGLEGHRRKCEHASWGISPFSHAVFHRSSWLFALEHNSWSYRCKSLWAKFSPNMHTLRYSDFS